MIILFLFEPLNFGFVPEEWRLAWNWSRTKVDRKMECRVFRALGSQVQRGKSTELWVEAGKGPDGHAVHLASPYPGGYQMASHTGEEGNSLRAWPPKPTVVVLKTLIVHGGPETPYSACWLWHWLIGSSRIYYKRLTLYTYLLFFLPDATQFPQTLHIYSL